MRAIWGLAALSLIVLSGCVRWPDILEPDRVTAAGTAIPGGIPPESVRAAARREAERFWGSRGWLTPCADQADIVYVLPGQKWYWMGRPIVFPNNTYAQTVGCRATTSGPVGKIAMNARVNWTYRKVCVIVTHELGHENGFGHDHADDQHPSEQPPRKRRHAALFLSRFLRHRSTLNLTSAANALTTPHDFQRDQPAVFFHSRGGVSRIAMLVCQRQRPPCGYTNRKPRPFDTLLT